MFGTKLKQLRTESGWSQEELAKRLNQIYNKSISKSMISRWESEKTDPQMGYVRLISDFFKKDFTYFFPDENREGNSLLNIYSKLDKKGKENVYNTAIQELKRLEKQ